MLIICFRGGFLRDLQILQALSEHLEGEFGNKTVMQGTGALPAFYYYLPTILVDNEMDTTQTETDWEARLDNAFILLSNVDYLDELVCERLNAMN